MHSPIVSGIPCGRRECMSIQCRPTGLKRICAKYGLMQGKGIQVVVGVAQEKRLECSLGPPVDSGIPQSEQCWTLNIRSISSSELGD